jgi:V/A-type H+-transporting ATPase subunit K
MRILASLIRWFKTSNIALVSLSIMAIITAVIWTMLFVGSGKAVAQQGGETSVVAQAGKIPESAWGVGLLAAAISTGLSAIAAGIAVAIVGSAAMGAVAERPEVMGRSIIFVGLAEGIAIYGLIISIMILSKLQ